MVKQRKTWRLKFLTVIFCFLFLNFHTLFVYADSATGNIAVGESEGRAGEQVEITIEITSNPGIVGIKVPIEYDNTGLMLVGVNAGGIFGDLTYSPSYEDRPYIIVGLGDMEDTKETGILATLVFEIREDALPGEYPVEIEMASNDAYNFSEEYVSFTSTNGRVLVVEGGEESEADLPQSNETSSSESQEEEKTEATKTPETINEIMDPWVWVGICVCILCVILYM